MILNLFRISDFVLRIFKKRSAPDPRNDRKGFTLIELLLVVGILAVVFGLALPFALNTKFTNELDAATENLITTLREAQSQAIAAEGDTPYGVYFDTTAAPPTYTIYKGASWLSKDESFNVGGYGTTELPKSAAMSLNWTGSPDTEITFARLTGQPLSSVTELSATSGLKALYHFNSTSGAEANKEGKELALGDLGSGATDTNINGLWHFNENFASNGSVIAAAAGPNGVLTTDNGATNKSAAGKFANAVLFDGTGDYVNIPYSPAFNTGSFTIAVWYKSTLSDIAGWRRIVGRKNAYNFRGLAIDGNGAETARVEVQLNGGSQWSVPGTSDVVDQNWHYIVGTYNGTILKIYVDGNLEGQDNPSPSALDLTGDSSDITIGQAQNSSFLPGLLDEVAIYDIALEAPAILEHYRRGIAEDAIINETTGNTFGPNDGNIYGPVTTASHTNLNQALSFDGVDDYVSIPTSTDFNFSATGGFSFFMWFKKSTVCDNGMGGNKNEVFAGRYGTNDTTKTWWFGCSGSAFPNKLILNAYPAGNVYLKSASTINDGVWHHGGWVYDGSSSQWRLYLDGVLQEEITLSFAGNFDSINSLYFGRYGGRFVPETLMPACMELEKAFNRYKNNSLWTRSQSRLTLQLLIKPSPLQFRILEIKLLP